MTTVPTRLAVLAAAATLTTAGLTALPAVASAQALPHCGNSSLTVTRTFTQGGAGHSWMALVYRNSSKHTCTVAGYPGLDAVNAKGHVLAHAKRTLSGYGAGGSLKTVTVKPGGFASASVEWLNFNGSTGGSCTFSKAVTTIVANTSRVHRLPVSVSVCGLQVHPTVAGTPQYPHYGPAQHYWIAGSKVSSAKANYYILHAQQQLQAGKDYPTQVAELKQLRSFPITGLTPAQITKVRALTKDLNSFFATPGLYL